MGLFDEQVTSLRKFLAEKKGMGQATEYRGDFIRPWPEGSSLVLQEDTALELGNPAVGSLFLLLWTEASAVEDDYITVVGGDVRDHSEKSVPFALVVLVGGTFSDEYECYREIKDAVYSTKLDGFMVRTLPSRAQMWCRVSREASDYCFSLAHLGAALIKNLKSIKSVSSAQVIFVTSSKEDLERLAPAASAAGRIVDAMMKMYEEKNFDCSTCEYRDVCESIDALKAMRKKLIEEKAK